VVVVLLNIDLELVGEQLGSVALEPGNIYSSWAVLEPLFDEEEHRDSPWQVPLGHDSKTVLVVFVALTVDTKEE
jgi:hypothetical protein